MLPALATAIAVVDHVAAAFAVPFRHRGGLGFQRHARILNDVCTEAESLSVRVPYRRSDPEVALIGRDRRVLLYASAGLTTPPLSMSACVTV